LYALVCDLQLPSKHCTDAYLAALAMSNGWRLAVPFVSHHSTRSGQRLQPTKMDETLYQVTAGFHQRSPGDITDWVRS
jgi:hypothetical protein